MHKRGDRTKQNKDNHTVDMLEYRGEKMSFVFELLL